MPLTARIRRLPTAASHEGDRAAHLHAEGVWINVSWLLILRWAAAVGQVLTIGTVRYILRIDVPFVPLLTIVIIELVSNAGFQAWFQRQRRLGLWAAKVSQAEALMGSLMLLDVLLLSGLLYFTGGSGNPFSVFYLVNLSLAAVLLKNRWAWALNILAFACYTLLFFFHRPLPPLIDLRQLGSGDLPLYARGLLIAFGAAMTFIAYFITRLRRELARLEAELSQAQQTKTDAERLEALGTLAAGAAHELSSPLSTVAVVAREMELQLERTGTDGELVEDVRLIRGEVMRCRAILDRMAGHAGESAGEELARLTVADLNEEVLGGLRDRERVFVDCPAEVGNVVLFVPRDALAQSLRAIVQNGLDASPGESSVWLTLRASDDAVQMHVRDAGHGMSHDVLARASDPFFTTKEPGQGMGLGLFLARKVIERLGGSLRLQSQPGKGTTAFIILPRAGSKQAAPSDWHGTPA